MATAFGSTLSGDFLERKSFSFMGVQLKFRQPLTGVQNTEFCFQFRIPLFEFNIRRSWLRTAGFDFLPSI